MRITRFSMIWLSPLAGDGHRSDVPGDVT